jgi:hypothetical protein
MRKRLAENGISQTVSFLAMHQVVLIMCDCTCFTDLFRDKRHISLSKHPVNEVIKYKKTGATFAMTKHMLSIHHSQMYMVLHDQLHQLFAAKTASYIEKRGWSEISSVGSGRYM